MLRRLFCGLAMAAALPVLLLTSPSLLLAQSGPLLEEDIAAIRANVDTYVERTLAGDFASVAALFTENAVMLPPNELMVQGRPAILAYLEAYPTITAFQSTVEELGGQGSMGFSRGTYSLTATVDGIPDPIQDTGKWLWIAEKQPDGSWLATIQIWNSDSPLPETS